MFVDLLFVLLSMLVPTTMSALGVPREATAPVLAATLLFWPGYAATLLIWPRPREGDIALKLAMSPLLSIIILLGISLVCWFAHLSVTPESISTYTIILAVVLLKIVATTRFLLDRRRQFVRQPSIGISSALGIYAAMCIVFSIAAAGPQRQADARPLNVTIYLDPAKSTHYQPANDAMVVPLVLKNSSEGHEIEVTLSGSVNGYMVSSEQIEIAAGATIETKVMIPRSSLSTTEARPIDIKAKGPGNEPVLRVWLNAVTARRTGVQE